MVKWRFRTRFHILAAFLLILLTVGFLTLALPADAAERPGHPAPSQPTAVKGGPPPALAIFFTGEVMGWTEPCG